MYCEKLLDGTDKRLEQRKTLEQIGEELCAGVKDPRDKAMRLVEMLHGKEYLIANAKWLGYDTGHIRNPSGENRPKIIALTDKDKQVEKIKGYIRKAGYEPDLYDVTGLVDSTLNLTENWENIQNIFPIFKPHIWHEYKPTIIEEIQFADYEDLLNILDISVGIVRKRSVDGWQDIEDTINAHLEMDESVWNYEPMQIFITSQTEENEVR